MWGGWEGEEKGRGEGGIDDCVDEDVVGGRRRETREEGEEEI